MARHRAPRAPLFGPRRTPAPEPPPPEQTAPTDRVLVEELPTEPAEVMIDYPDGTTMPIGCEYGGPTGTRERWIAVVPSAARLANGMVIRVDRDTVLAVAVNDGNRR